MENITDFVFRGGNWRELGLWFRDKIVSAIPAINIAMVVYDVRTRRAESWHALYASDEPINPDLGPTVVEQAVNFIKQYPVQEKVFSLIVNMNVEDIPTDGPPVPMQLAATAADIFRRLDREDWYFAALMVVTPEDIRYVMPQEGPTPDVTAGVGGHERFDDPTHEGHSVGRNPILHAAMHENHRTAVEKGDYDVAAALERIIEADHNDDEAAKVAAMKDLAQLVVAKLGQMTDNPFTSSASPFSAAAEPFESPKRRSIFELPPLDDDEPTKRPN